MKREIQPVAKQLWVHKDDGSTWSVTSVATGEGMSLQRVEGDDVIVRSLKDLRAHFDPAPGHQIIELGEGVGVIQITPTLQKLDGNHLAIFFVDPLDHDKHQELLKKGFERSLSRFGRTRTSALLIGASFGIHEDMCLESRKKVKATAVQCVLEKIADLQTFSRQITKANIDLTPEGLRSLMLTI